MKELRTHPIIFAGLLLFYLVILPGLWIAYYQPVGGLPLTHESQQVLLAFLLSSGLAFGLGWKPGYGGDLAQRFSRMWLPKVLSAITSFGCTLLLLEMAMRLLIVQSDAYGFTLMHRFWQERYWQPVNSMGFRDTEPRAREDVLQILVTGDSFVAGHGINDYRDTFTQQLGSLLGESYTVNLAAHPGWQIDLELDAVDRYPLTPDILIFSYCFNDILTVAPPPGLQLEMPGKLFRPLIDYYFIGDFLYWHMYHNVVHSPETSYTDLLLALYDDPVHWRNQTDWLQAVIESSEESGARLIVVTWPPLNALEAGQAANAMVVNFYRERGITVIDMGELLAGKPTSELTVNKFDSHPNEEVHQLVAKALYEAISQQPSQ